MEFNPINELKKELYESEIKINKLEQTIKEFSNKNIILLEENEKLNQNHKQNQETISNHKIRINYLENQIKSNQQRISELKNEIISQKKELQGRDPQLLDIPGEDNSHVIFSNKLENDQPNNSSNLHENENRINNFENKGNIINNQENKIDNTEDEEKEIKNKFFNLFKGRENVDEIYEKMGKEQISQIFKNTNKMENQKLKKDNENINMGNSRNNNINNVEININNNNSKNNINSNNKININKIYNNNINNSERNNNINNNRNNNSSINNNEINNNKINNNSNININSNKNEININSNINNNKTSLSSKFNEDTKKKKIKYEQMSIDLKGKCSQYHTDIEQAKYLIENYKNYLNEINKQITLKNEKSMIKYEMDQITINIDEKENLEFIDSQMKVISSSISKLNNIYSDFKNNFGSNVEHLLTNIFANLRNLNKKENKNDIKKISIIIYEVGAKIEELQKICNLFEKNRNLFYAENDKIFKEVNKLQNKIFKENVVNNQNNKNELFNILNNNDDYNENKLAQSFLIRYRSQPVNKSNEDNFNGDLMEDYIDEPKLIRKNWEEKCYIYDDKDIHDVFYDIKAVSNDNKLIFNSCSYAFDYDKSIKIKYLTVDDTPVPHTKKLNSIEFKIKLYNSQTSKIHIMYEESKDLSKLNKGEIEERKIYREGKYGLQSTLYGQNAKYSLILKGSFDIVNFTEYFLIKKDNLKTTEYFWEGIVPYNGKITNIIFSKSEAMWSFNVQSKILVENGIKNFKYIKPFDFIGGNNEIENLSYSSPQAKNIVAVEENRVYYASYENIEKEVEFFIKGQLKNKSKGEWSLDITDEDLEKRVPDIDKILKPQLKNLAKEIIEDFDRTNINKDFVFLDYMKIGLWVHKNIKYDLNYTEKDELTPIDVYYQRAGVSHHFTILTNALLYALGYKVVYAMGYVSQNNKEFNQDSRHSWTLINLNNRWYPFDATFGIFSGKLPISHIFDRYFYSGTGRCDKGLKLEKDKVSGIYIS